MSNFTLRFIYEFFFEICLCVMIHMATVGDASEFLYSLSVLLTIAILAFLGLLFLLFYRYGPYVPKSFERNSLRKSWWGARHLCEDAELCTLQTCVDLDIEKQQSPQDTNSQLLRTDSPINPDEEKKSPTETGRALLGFDEVQAVTFEEEEPMDILSPMSDGIIDRQYAHSPALYAIRSNFNDQANDQEISENLEGGETEHAPYLNFTQRCHLKPALAKEL